MASSTFKILSLLVCLLLLAFNVVAADDCDESTPVSSVSDLNDNATSLALGDNSTLITDDVSADEDSSLDNSTLVEAAGGNVGTPFHQEKHQRRHRRNINVDTRVANLAAVGPISNIQQKAIFVSLPIGLAQAAHAADVDADPLMPGSQTTTDDDNDDTATATDNGFPGLIAPSVPSSPMPPSSPEGDDSSTDDSPSDDDSGDDDSGDDLGDDSSAETNGVSSQHPRKHRRNGGVRTKVANAAVVGPIRNIHNTIIVIGGKKYKHGATAYDVSDEDSNSTISESDSSEPFIPSDSDATSDDSTADQAGDASAQAQQQQKCDCNGFFASFADKSTAENGGTNTGSQSQLSGVCKRLCLRRFWQSEFAADAL